MYTLKQLRSRAGLTQKEVALELDNITQGAISQWESGDAYPQALML